MTEVYLRNCLRGMDATGGGIQVTTEYNTSAPGIQKYIPRTIRMIVTLRDRSGRMQVRNHTFSNTGGAGRPAWVRDDAPCV